MAVFLSTNGSIRDTDHGHQSPPGRTHLLRAAREAGVVVTGSFSAVGHRLDDPSEPSAEALQSYPFERLMPMGKA